MNQQAPDATARADTGQAGTGIATGQEQLYAQGLPKGAIMQRFGSAASVVRDLPGWFIADGTQPALVIDGVSYGSPNFNKMTIMGADGTAGFVAGNTGGAAAAGGHTHSFTQPTGHNDHALGHNHDSTAVTAHSNHAMGGSTEILNTPGTNVWVNYATTAALAAAGLAHDNNHSVTQPAAHTDPLVHSANHSGGAVGAVSSPSTAYPPYVAVYILIKVFD